MKKNDFDNSEFFCGMKGRVGGIWFGLISSDFEFKTITIDDGKASVIPCWLIDELESIESSQIVPCRICGRSCCAEYLHDDDEKELLEQRLIRNNHKFYQTNIN